MRSIVPLLDQERERTSSRSGASLLALTILDFNHGVVSIDIIDRVYWLDSVYRRSHGAQSRVKRAIETMREMYDGVHGCRKGLGEL